MRVIGTAGHVDHGKSTLVQALTGTHPDRLKEEKLREMTIDLGFAWLTLPDGEQVGIVDVPGHRDFIENMLAGVGGIDAILFVIAADEGIMPQTREHLAIVDLLQVPAGLIVLTKIDLVHDPEWLELLQEEIRRVFSGTVLAEVPILKVSAVTGEGITELKEAIADCLKNVTPRPDLGKPRLPIDRVFSIAGFGTVVTGTLLDGGFKLGDEVEILPSGKRARIRGLQNHKQKIQHALPGRRTAVNLSGVEVTDVKRGEVLVLPGDYAATGRIDVSIRLLSKDDCHLKQNEEVKIFTGTNEATAHIRLLGANQLRPAEIGLAQIETKDKLVVASGDRFILRRPSPAATLGGGVVIDPHPVGRVKLSDRQSIERLQKLMENKGTSYVEHLLQKEKVTTVDRLLAGSREEESSLFETLKEMVGTGRIILLSEGEFSRKSLIISAENWNELTQRCLAVIQTYHQKNPLRGGLPREELRASLDLEGSVYAAALKKWLDSGQVKARLNILSLPGHQVKFTTAQQKKIDQLWKEFSLAPYSPPGADECRTIIGDDTFNALIELGELVRVNPGVVFRKHDFATMCAFIAQKAELQASFTVVEFRDRFQTSRKYALALLEFLDSAGITRREGDGRVVVKPEYLRSYLED